jgi:excinuclease ABC subunit B
MEKNFKLISDFKPKGDQGSAIEKLVRAFHNGKPFQTLLGVTGSGKTFTVANVIEKLQLPVLVISHNKTLAAQLYSEFREFFPENRVEYFVSYYDYYQPEAYIPQKDIYIEKDASINEALDRLRLCATNAVLSRRDVIIVASVSCIYNIGSPEEYSRVTVSVEEGQHINRDSFLRKLVAIQYERNDLEPRRGKFRVRGDSVELFPSYQDKAIKISFCQDVIEKIEELHPVTLETVAEHEYLEIYPAKHFMMPEDRIAAAVISIKEELEERLAELEKQGKQLEAHRLKTRTLYDIEMLTEIGYCKGIENYSRHLSCRPPGSRPYCLLDYFPKDFLVVVDESHVTVPQIRGMFNGDRSRKETLVEHGFRLPSALDNRPLCFDEWEELVKRAIFVSATPEQYEIARSGNEVVEQIIRPTGLVDPKVTVHQTTNQIKHLTELIKERMKRKERVLITTLTKRLAEDLSEHLEDENIPCTYLHSEIDTIERVDILRSLRQGNFDVLVGVNLLREGLDLPEVSLVAILDADKEGFLRSETALVQTIGRTARNVNGEVILYADTITGSMKRALSETDRRRKIQIAYNKRHNITPTTIQKGIYRGIEELVNSNKIAKEALSLSDENFGKIESVRELQRQMFEAAAILDFEHAAKIRDEILRLRGIAPEHPAVAVQKGRFARFHRRRRVRH